MSPRHLFLVLVAALIQAGPARLTAQKFNGVSEKLVPPPGIAIPDNAREELEQQSGLLGGQIESLRSTLSDPQRLALLPDVQIFHNAVRYPLHYNEFYRTGEVATAKSLLQQGFERVQALQGGAAPWTDAAGNSVRGYRSRVDDSIQPYGLVIPSSWKPGDRRPRPLWIWLHGRSETLTELAFLSGQIKTKPEFPVGDAFLARPYGRFCNASKFAGETDFFEVLDDVKRRYPIDPDRIVVVGFSMGGASCWHLAAHHAGWWAAASPGAGFAETAVYAHVWEPGHEKPTPWEQKLWHWYDATDYAANLFNTRLIAYSGGDDPQKQSSDIMEAAMAAEGLTLERLIGPKTGHKYEPETKKELDRRLAATALQGKPALPRKVRFTTYTLRYNSMDWIEIDSLGEHWKRADISAESEDDGLLRVSTTNVVAFSTKLEQTGPRRVSIDGQTLTDLNEVGHYRRQQGRWVVASDISEASQRKTRRPLGPVDDLIMSGLAKHHGLTGPVDDAFMDSFVFVRPTGRPINEKLGKWTESELIRAITEWRRVFRGEPRVKDDTAITEEDVANSNLVLWGDPSSNSCLRWVLPNLPIHWTAERLELVGLNYANMKKSAADFVPILVYPNPLNRERYIVLNSGFTFRKGSSQSNSLQTPRLPDWAIIDLRVPPSDQWPGAVRDAGFFNESWVCKPGSSLVPHTDY